MNPAPLSKRVKLTLTLILSVFFLLPVYSYSSSLGDLRISLIEGDVQIKTADTDDWIPATINIPVMAGDILWVPERGKAGVQARDGSVVRLDENTSLEVLTLEQDSYQFHLTTGHAYVNFNGRKGTFLQMDTPVSSIRAYDPSVFRLDVSDDGLTEVSVFRGTVSAESQGGETRVSSGSTLSLGGDNYAEISPLGPADEWERWNKDRDQRISGNRDSARYLPPEIQPYSYDFDENGRWQSVPGYGYVWRPTVVVSAGWAPYRAGRWTWIGGDYVWVSYEPWGWAPYHYGRWAFVASMGWFWVPPLRGDVYWGPGFVGWVSTPTYVSWVPLAPREVYYGHGYYGRYSVNITHVNITNINVNNIVYQNVRIKNSVTTLHHDTFVRGRQVDIHVRENPFVAHKIHVGRPDIKPERATRMPIIKEIPQKERPPERIREIRVKQLKEERPLVKERNISVLNPKAQPKELAVKTRESRPGERPGGEAPPEKTVEKLKTPQTRMGESKGTKPPEIGEVEKQREVKPPVKGIERPKATEGGLEKSKEVRATERKVEKPAESKSLDRGGEKPKEVKPAERGFEKQKEVNPSARGTVERPKEVEPTQRGVERQRTYSPTERGVERPRTNGSPERTIERQKSGRSGEKGGETPKEMGPGGKRFD